jgi:hypothetical protein
MMDPFTILSTIGTCMSVLKVTISGVQGIWELKKQYDQVDINVAGIRSKLQSIQFSLSLLGKWARNGGGDAELVIQLQSSIHTCSVVVAGINAEIEGASEPAGLRDKLKLLWNENVITEIERKLDSQINALSFLLNTVQL